MKGADPTSTVKVFRQASAVLLLAVMILFTSTGLVNELLELLEVDGSELVENLESEPDPEEEKDSTEESKVDQFVRLENHFLSTHELHRAKRAQEQSQSEKVLLDIPYPPPDRG